ncbi:zinc finger protein 853 [Nematolebias whitei]|uniref:zinc finger protein 853 n=1 Tax=Nematolebias whitei TaxID=451745 RepID=UPI0018991CB0|nr:zinc finger protein 853 [Nematolebias whitei]
MAAAANEASSVYIYVKNGQNTGKCPQLYVDKEQEVLMDQQMLDQEDPEPPQVKEDQEEVCISQLVLKQETGTIKVLQCTSQLAAIHGGSENRMVEHEEEMGPQCRLLEINWKPVVKLHRMELLQKPVFTKEEVLMDQQLSKQDRNYSLVWEEQKPSQIKVEQEELEPPQIKEDHEETGPSQIKEEQEELGSSQDVEQLVIKEETDILLVTTNYGVSDSSESEPSSGHLFSDLTRLKEKTDLETDDGKRYVCNIC